MKKAFIFLALGMVLVLAGGVIAASLSSGTDATVNDVVKKVISDKGFNRSQVKDIQQVDFNNLPEEVNISNIDDNNLALYQVDLGTDKPVYVLTVSDEKFKKTVEEIVTRKMFLNFGSPEEFSSSKFLDTATGVETSYQKGYVMMREGSITGMSTNLDVTKGQGKIDVILYINGEEIGFRNSITTDSTGIKNDYDVQSENVVTFEPGDIVSIYVKTDGQISAKDVTTLVEILVNN